MCRSEPIRLAMLDETTKLAEDAQIMLGKLSARLTRLEVDGDDTTVRWLHKRIVAIERDAQKRET